MKNIENTQVAKVNGESSRSKSTGQKKKVIRKNTRHCELVQKGNSKASDINGSIVLTRQLVDSIDASKPMFELRITQGFLTSPKLASMKQGSKKEKVMPKQV